MKIFRTRPRKNFASRATLCMETKKIILVGSGKYPWGGPCAMMSSKRARMSGTVPPYLMSSGYQVCVTFVCAYQSYLIKGRTPSTYVIIASKYPCVTPSLLCRKCLTPPPSWITSVAQWWQKLKVNCEKMVHSYWNTHIMSVRLS